MSDYKDIPGLLYVPNFVSEDMQHYLLNKIETQEWQTSLKRRVQQYGPIYNYQTKVLDESISVIPMWLKLALFGSLKPYFTDGDPSQIIINEYEPRQQITKHKDAKFFGPTIASLSLLSDAIMKIGQYNGDEFDMLLEHGSLVVMSGAARSHWYHAIPPVENKRISITFRTIL